MPQIELTASSGDATTDRVLRGALGLMERLFPGRLRACYLTGSVTDGSAVATSDLDGYLVSKGGFRDAAEQRTACCACGVSSRAGR
jgi:hypothetical protein